MALIRSIASVGGAGVSIIDKTHAEMLALVEANALIPWQKYRITDFRTRHLIPNTTDYHVGSEEPLIVTAITNNTLELEAISELYPQDIIHYKLIYSGVLEADRGWIVFRKDQTLEISTHEDFRNMKYRRWESSPGSGVFTEIYDNAGSYQDFYIFQNSQNPNNVVNTHIPKSYQDYINVVIGSGGNNTILGAFYNNTLGYFADNIIVKEFAKVTSQYFNYNISFDIFYDVNCLEARQNIFFREVYQNTFGESFINNILLHNINNSVFGKNFRNNYVEDEIRYMTIPDNSQNMKRINIFFSQGLDTYEGYMNADGYITLAKTRKIL